MSGDSLSPGSARGFVTRAAPEPNKRALYVGGLDPRVTEDVLKQIFETTGHVQSVKIIPDKNVSRDLANFAEQQVNYAPFFEAVRLVSPHWCPHTFFPSFTVVAANIVIGPIEGPQLWFRGV
jgi:hypothetical protein